MFIVCFLKYLRYYDTIDVISLIIFSLLIVHHEFNVFDVLKETKGGLTVYYLL